MREKKTIKLAFVLPHFRWWSKKCFKSEDEWMTDAVPKSIGLKRKSPCSVEKTKTL